MTDLVFCFSKKKTCEFYHQQDGGCTCVCVCVLFWVLFLLGIFPSIIPRWGKFSPTIAERSDVEASSPVFSKCLLSRELTYPTWGSSENHGLNSAFTKGICDRSQESTFAQFLQSKGLPISYVMDICNAIYIYIYITSGKIVFWRVTYNF